MQEILQYIFPLLGLALFGTIFWLAMRWCIDDARLRNKSPFMVCCAVILFFPWGWIAWLVFRPDAIDGSSFDLNRYRRQ